MFDALPHACRQRCCQRFDAMRLLMIRRRLRTKLLTSYALPASAIALREIAAPLMILPATCFTRCLMLLRCLRYADATLPLTIFSLFRFRAASYTCHAAIIVDTIYDACCRAMMLTLLILPYFDAAAAAASAMMLC